MDRRKLIPPATRVVVAVYFVPGVTETRVLVPGLSAADLPHDATITISLPDDGAYVAVVTAADGAATSLCETSKGVNKALRHVRRGAHGW